MAKSLITPAIHRYIIKYRFKKSGKNIARHFGIGAGIVQRYMRKNGLSIPELHGKFKGMGNIGRTSSSPKEDAFLKKHYLKMPVKRIAAEIGRSHTFVDTRLKQLGLIIPREVIEQRKKDSRIKPGTTPPNKGKKMSPEVYAKVKRTMFKKGNRPAQTKERDGVIVIRHDHPDRNQKAYKFIRISLSKWIPLHKYLWENKYGPIPKGHCLWFRDGNTMNCELDNLELITRAENMSRNTMAGLPGPLRQVIVLNNKIKRKINEQRKQTSA